MSYVTNNTHRYSYNLLNNELKKITSNMFIAKLGIFNKCLFLCLWPSKLCPLPVYQTYFVRPKFGFMNKSK